MSFHAPSLCGNVWTSAGARAHTACETATHVMRFMEAHFAGSRAPCLHRPLTEPRRKGRALRAAATYWQMSFFCSSARSPDHSRGTCALATSCKAQQQRANSGQRTLSLSIRLLRAREDGTE
jgi:hypothetical protein